MQEESPATLRVKAAQTVRLALTISNETARDGLLDYARQLIERASELEAAVAPLQAIGEIRRKAAN